MAKGKETAHFEKAILTEIETRVRDLGFLRKKGSKVFIQETESSKRLLDFYFTKPSHSDDKSIFHLDLFLEVEMTDVNDKALEIVQNPILLANATASTIRQSIGLVSPKRTLLQWSPRRESEVMRVPEAVVKRLCQNLSVARGMFMKG